MFLVTPNTKSTSSTCLILESWLNKTLCVYVTGWHLFLANIMESHVILNRSRHMPRSAWIQVSIWIKAFWFQHHERWVIIGLIFQLILCLNVAYVSKVVTFLNYVLLVDHGVHNHYATSNIFGNFSWSISKISIF
jgi:hypothetical protein